MALLSAVVVFGLGLLPSSPCVHRSFDLLLRLTHHLFLSRLDAPTKAMNNAPCFNLEMLLRIMCEEATVVAISGRGLDWIKHNRRTDAGGAIIAAVRAELVRYWRLEASRRSSFLGRLEVYSRLPSRTSGMLLLDGRPTGISGGSSL